MVDGQPAPVTIDPRPGDKGLLVQGDDWRMGLGGLGPDGQQLRLAPSGALILQSERAIRASGSGFLPGSVVDLYIDPPVQPVTATRTWFSALAARVGASTYVGTMTVDATGSFAGRLALPAGIRVGAQVLQSVGFSLSGQTRALSLGVLVEPSLTLVKQRRERAGQHDVIRASGTATGLPAGTRLVPHIRYSGQSTFRTGNGVIVVQADGTFRWSKRVNPRRAAHAYVSWRTAASNRVTWPVLR